ncbi:MAG TPA: TonB-dependent receptor [Candidatus Sulfotelmatobacter sp.]|nr:TonB-dependent receptor [Candidatus Sulfotelmatobacter sp.]
MRSGARAVAQLLGSLALFAILVSAQTATTSLRGTITDAKGAIVQGAAVTLTNPATGFTRTTKSGTDGVYQFVELPPATYTLTVAVPGFATIKQDHVALLVNQPATLDEVMQVKAANEIIEVSGTAPLVNTQDASIGHAFNNEQVLSLPFEGRDPTAILSLQPGVAYTGNSGSIDPTIDSRNGSVAGGRSDQANITIDGVDNNDPVSGNALSGVFRATLDSLQEFRVTTAGGTADEGRASGAQVVQVTKSGTNAFHGSLFAYERPTFTTANDPLLNAAQSLAGQPNRPLRVLRHTFGASLGGPLIKDRFFFFASYEGQRNREDTLVTRIVPSDNLRNGIVSYIADDGSVVTLTPQQLAGMDPNCSTTPGFGAGGTCPLGPGANPAVMQIFNQYPHPNTDVVGDGFNFRGFQFAAPAPAKLNTSIIKLDYNLTRDANHRLFVRGNLQGDNQAGLTLNGPQFPGEPPDQTEFSNNKGIAIGYTALFHSNLINNFRYGYIRQGLDLVGLQTSNFVNFRGMDDITGQTSTVRSIIPVHNFVDDITWTKGKHSLQFGANFRIINDGRIGNADSFNFGQTNVSWLDNAGIANTGSSLDPAAFGFVPVSSDFGQSYDLPVAALTGIVPFAQGDYNQDKNGTQIPNGSFITRNFRAHEGEMYAQDAFRVKPNLTLTFGLRYTLLQPPYESHGNQIAPDVSLNDFFKKRFQAMMAGQTYDPLIGLNISGQANGKKPYWAWDYKDFAPRFAIAWSPNADSGWMRKLSGGPGKTSIRAGAGIYYDHFGEGIVNTFDRNGSFGLTTLIDNPAATQDVDNSPRFSQPTIFSIPTQSGACSGPPPCSTLPPAPAPGFPAIPPTADQNGGFSITWGLDDKLKTPYSEVYNLSITREMPHGFVLETAYVGRFAHRLLQEEDLAMPLDIVDPASHQDYFSAAQTLGKAALAGTSINNLAPIPYWEHLFPGAAGQLGFGPPGNPNNAGCAPGTNPNVTTYTATQAMYDQYSCFVGNETTALFFADLLCLPACAQLPGQSGQTALNYFDSQWSSLYAWRSVGNSDYNGLQVSLRKQVQNGLTFDVNYTYSKSFDVGSNAERINEFEGFGFASQIINAWSPKQLRAVSDFDNTHQINANWVYDLPVGRGKYFGGNMGTALNAIVGGWQFAGLWRWSSGFPFTVEPGLGFWSTDWQLTSPAVFIGPKPKTGQFRVLPTANQTAPQPDVFQNPSQAAQSFRVALAGESGNRNNLRGPGTFDIDASLAKKWQIAEGKNITFRWEAFNVTNTAKFDVGQMQFQGNNSLATAGTFGVFLNTLNKPRLMEFALRFDF